MQTFSGYFGVQGSGKSFEIVKNVILPALSKTHRRIVANIDGLNAEAISEYLGFDVSERIIMYRDEELLEPGFLPTQTEVDDAYSESIVQPGDLLIIDEGARTLGVSKKPPERVIDFIRMARHYTDDRGMPCNIVVAAQALTMIHKDCRSMLASIVKTRKHIAVGRPDAYVVHVYDGDKPTRDALCNTYQEKYDPEIFPLYKTSSGGHGMEVIVDDRVNMLKGRGFNYLKWGIGISIAMSLLGIYFVYSWFTGVKEKAEKRSSHSVSAPKDPAAHSSGPSGAIQAESENSVRSVIGEMQGSSGVTYLILDGPDGVIVTTTANALKTEAGWFLSYEGKQYSTLGRTARAGGSSSSILGGKSG